MAFGQSAQMHSRHGWPVWKAIPAFAGMDIGYDDEGDEEEGGANFYFPDGNASIARLPGS